MQKGLAPHFWSETQRTAMQSASLNTCRLLWISKTIERPTHLRSWKRFLKVPNLLEETQKITEN